LYRPSRFPEAGAPCEEQSAAQFVTFNINQERVAAALPGVPARTQ
jgi:hypothetical protein